MSTLSFLSSLISKQPNISINNKGSAKINEFSPLVIHLIVPQKNTEKPDCPSGDQEAMSFKAYICF